LGSLERAALLEQRLPNIGWRVRRCGGDVIYFAGGVRDMLARK
jgi:hypothetical protein